MLGTQYVFNKYSVEGINSIHVRISARLYPGWVIPLLPTTHSLFFLSDERRVNNKGEGNEIDNFKGKGRKKADRRESGRITWRAGSPHVFSVGPVGSYLWERGPRDALQGTKEHGVWVPV